jgi:voltage-gated potassium channel
VELDDRSERMQQLFNLPTLVAALLVIPVIALEELQVGEPWHTVGMLANWAIWLTFGAQVVAMLAVVPDRWEWIRRNPIDVAIVVLTPPFLPASMQSARAFRLLRLLRLLVTLKRIRGFFSLEGLRYASVIALFGILGGGTAFAAVESDQNLSAWDGVWWACTTITTVGYGDIVPHTSVGRVIAIVVMFVGIGYLAMLTAALAHLFLSGLVKTEATQVEKEAVYAENVVLARLDQLADQLARLEHAVLARGSR